jgi:glycosyltransferase involved in cell wall biosynthesis
MKINNPKVSIIIPVYNGSDYLSQAIDSALNQTYTNIEVIVVNDGSNDEGASDKIALSYGNAIKYYFKENGGVSSALNLGICKMTGEYFSWLSHDDIYMPDKIEKQVKRLRELDFADVIIYSGYRAINKKSKVKNDFYPILSDPEYFFYDLFCGWPVHGCTVLIPKICFSKVGLFNESNKTAQDYEMWFRLLKAGYQFILVPEALIKFRVHSAQASLTTEDSYYQEREDTYKQMVNIFKDEIINLDNEKKESLLNNLIIKKELRQTAQMILELCDAEFANAFIPKHTKHLIKNEFMNKIIKFIRRYLNQLRSN